MLAATHPVLEVLAARAPEQQSPLNVALALAQLDVSVLPVHTTATVDGKHQPKSPATPRGYKDATTDAATVTRWFGQDADNKGLAFIPRTARMVIIDVDRADTLPDVRLFIADVWGLSDEQVGSLTPTIRTANSQNPDAKSYGGSHWVVFVPAEVDFPLFSIRSLAERLGIAGVDILGGTEDRIVVAPPTRIDGFHYRVTGPALPYNSRFGEVLRELSTPAKSPVDPSPVTAEVAAQRDAFTEELDAKLSWDAVFADTPFTVNGRDGQCVTMHHADSATDKSVTVHHESACGHGAGGVTVFSQTVLSAYPPLQQIANKRGSVSDTPTFTKLQFHAAVHHAGSVRDALTSLGIDRQQDADDTVGGSFDPTVTVVSEGPVTVPLKWVDFDEGSQPDSHSEPFVIPLFADRVPVTLGKVTRNLGHPTTGVLDVDDRSAYGVERVRQFGVSLGSPLPAGMGPIPFSIPDISDLVDDGTAYSPAMMKVLTESSPLLAHCTHAARKRALGPLAVIAGMQRAVASNIPLNVEIPGVVSGPSPLNVIHLMLGVSGAGKSGSAGSIVDVQRYSAGFSPALFGGAAEDADFVVDAQPKIPGSGQAIATFYADTVQDKDADGKAFWVTEQHTHSVTVAFDESDGLLSQLTNDKSTLSAELRTAWSGTGPIGSNVKTKANNISIPGWTYRLVVVIASQVVNAGPLFDNATGGLVQRMHIVGTADPSPWDFERTQREHSAGIYRITLPDVQALDIPVSIRREIWDARIAGALRPDESETADFVSVDGHRMLVRLREAAILALAHGYTGITPEIWEWSRWWSEHSRRVQKTVTTAKTQQRKLALIGKGTDEVYVNRSRSVEITKLYDRAVFACRGWVERNPDKQLTRTELSRGPASKVRKELGKDGFTEFLEYLTDVAGFAVSPDGVYTMEVSE